MGININDGNFRKEVLEESLPVLVDFWAVWCGPCLRLAPVIDEIAGEYKGKLKICKLNVDDAPKIAASYEIMSIPTVAIFKNGEIVDKFVGALPKEEIEAVIKKQI